jgi:ABC-type microcin C transport system permease subunit YejB
MWRIALTIVSVLVVDFVFLVVAMLGPLEANMVQISRALAAQMDNPTPENKRALDAAKRKAAVTQLQTRAAFGVAILIVTAGGFFIAGRQFQRRRSQASGSVFSHRATIHT